jgi:hypothetical protein
MLYPIRATTHAVSGEAIGEVLNGGVAADGTPAGYVEVPIRALRSWNPIEDFEMRRAVEARRFPALRFELLTVCGGPDRFEIHGALVAHGVRREFDGSVRVHMEDDRLTVDGEHTFDVREFGITPPHLLGIRVDHDVRVVAHLVGRETLPPER